MIRGALRGALSGLIATVPMTAVMEQLFRRLPRKERYPLPPREITMKVAKEADVHDKLSQRQRTLLTLLAHFAYGASVGAIYGMLCHRRKPHERGGVPRGIGYGLLVWAGSYLGLLPTLRILTPATQHPQRRNLLMIAAHIVWGAATGWMVRKLNQRDYRFEGKTVLITGGSRGLGLELARQWARQGSNVAICARTQEDLDTAVSELREYGSEVLGVVCDVTSRDDVDRMVRQVIDEWGRLDVLVNNAGIIQVGPEDCMTLADYEASMKTHYWAHVYAVRAVLPHMRSRGEGRIVNITSIGGKISVPHLLPYSASKFAAVGLSEGLRSELAPAGIVVTTVCPGLMRTGSARNASFKGQHRKEYAWFSISDSLPLVSINSARAARQIVEASRRGDAYFAVSLPCKIVTRLHGVFPNLSMRVLEFINRWLPSTGGIGTRTKTGKQSYSRWSPSLLTTLNEKAARANNEMSHNGAHK